jgi:probable F420-dependent oxidoreductase
MIPDHVAMGPHAERYPYGRFPLPQDEPWPEPLTTLAAMAGASSRVRLATGVLIAPLRPPLLLAKTLATLDALSCGRLDVGVGVGWQEEEYSASGLAFEQRWSLLDDGLRACRALWSDLPARFSSPSVSFEEIWSVPQPVQPGGPPLWFGVRLLPRNIARIVEHGSGWMPMESDADTLRDGVAALRAGFERAGRSFESFAVRAHAPVVMADKRTVDLDATLAGVPELLEAGATSIAFALARFVRTRQEVPDFFARIGGWRP